MPIVSVKIIIYNAISNQSYIFFTEREVKHTLFGMKRRACDNYLMNELGYRRYYTSYVYKNKEEFIMDQIIIRDVEKKDLPKIKAIIGRTWKLDRLIENGSSLEGALGIYINAILHRSSFGKVAVLHDQVIGCIFGSYLDDEPICRFLQEEGASHTLALLAAMDHERTNIMEFISKTFHTHELLISDTINDYQGCLEFIAVEEEARGLKIGRKLWDELSNYFKSKKAGYIYVFSDTDSNYGFYDYHGFSRKKEKTINFDFTFQQEKQTMFLYDYQFKTP